MWVKRVWVSSMGEWSVVSSRGSAVDAVVKIGGGLLQHAVDFASTLVTISQAAVTRRVLVVPGGGPFADAVRAVDRLIRLSDDEAHWLAVSAMDHTLASLPGACQARSSSRRRVR